MHRGRREQGAALLEAALCMPLLLVLVMGITDLGRYINTHLTASRLAYETSRFSAVVPELEKGTMVVDFNEFGVPAGAVQPNQTLIVHRVSRMVKQLNARGKVIDQVHIAAFFRDDCTDDANSPDNKAIRLEVEIPLTPLFPLISKTSVKARSNSGYLYAKETVCAVS